MSKFTKRFKKYKRTYTMKRGGGDRKGVLDILGDKISGVAGSTAKTVTDATLKIMGLKRIQDADPKLPDPQNPPVLTSALDNIGDVADKTGATLLSNVNEVLASDAVQQTAQQVANDTADIVKHGAHVFNEALNNPDVKAEINEAIEHAGDLADVVVKASEKPFEEAVEVAAKSAPKIASALLSGSIKVGTDAVAAVPGVGALVEVGKMMNDGSKAASAVVEAGTEVVEAATDAFVETKENVARELKALDTQKKMADQIANRTTKSIVRFENPMSSSMTGGKKTKRRLFKRKQSKRVRFAV